MNNIKLPSNLAKKRSQHGNALFIILIGIGLFAALSYAVSQMLNGGGTTGSITKETAALKATEILDYARAVRDSVHDLQISNGCSDEDISLENLVEGGYVNGANTSCQVFHSSGGGVSYILPSNEWLNQSQSGSSYFRKWWIVPVFVEDVGSADKRELVMNLPYVDLQICLQINEKLGITNPSGNLPGTDGTNWVKFQGDYDDSTTGAIESLNGISQIQGKNVGCYLNQASDVIFYQVLIAR